MAGVSLVERLSWMPIGRMKASVTTIQPRWLRTSPAVSAVHMMMSTFMESCGSGRTRLRGGTPVATRVFISYDYDNDAFLKEALVGQSKLPDSPFDISDWSIK